MSLTRDRLAQSLHRRPGIHEPADALNTDLAGLLTWERKSGEGAHVSLEAPTQTDHDRGPSRSERLLVVEQNLDLELDRERERERLREAP